LQRTKILDEWASTSSGKLCLSSLQNKNGKKITFLLYDLLLDKMLLHQSIFIMKAEKEKRPVSDLAAYVASRNGSENGVLCNDWAQEILVIIDLHQLFSLCGYISLLLCHGDNVSNRKSILKLQRRSMVQILT
jgi:uncharacterized Rossmann fold enzyme